MLCTAMNQYQNSLNALNRKKKKWSKKPFENRRKYLLDHLSKKKGNENYLMITEIN